MIPCWLDTTSLEAWEWQAEVPGPPAMVVEPALELTSSRGDVSNGGVPMTCWSKKPASSRGAATTPSGSLVRLHSGVAVALLAFALLAAAAALVANKSEGRSSA